ncbi:hypothetical protein GCM10027614_55070 [Micromonospora vulcania]
MPVKMSVSPPATWGRIQGTSTGVSCGGTSVPLRATVRVNRVGTTTGHTLTANAQGRYTWWLPRGRYEVIVARDGWVPKTQRVRIAAGTVRTVDFVLDPAESCARATGI